MLYIEKQIGTFQNPESKETLKSYLHGLVVRKSPASKDANAEAEEFKAFGAVIKLRLMKTERERERSITA
jgi:hypothetical protein